jgi:hypothetical protein
MVLGMVPVSTARTVPGRRYAIASSARKPPRAHAPALCRPAGGASDEMGEVGKPCRLQGRHTHALLALTLQPLQPQSCPLIQRRGGRRWGQPHRRLARALPWSEQEKTLTAWLIATRTRRGGGTSRLDRRKVAMAVAGSSRRTDRSCLNLCLAVSDRRPLAPGHDHASTWTHLARASRSATSVLRARSASWYQGDVLVYSDEPWPRYTVSASSSFCRLRRASSSRSAFTARVRLCHGVPRPVLSARARGCHGQRGAGPLPPPCKTG